MNNLKLLTFSVVAVLSQFLAGCIPSVHPLFTEADLLSEPGLVGGWITKDGAEDWVIRKAEGEAYELRCRSADGRTGAFRLHYFKVGDRGFVDLHPEGSVSQGTDFFNSHFFPTHTFLRVRELGAVLRLETLRDDWLKAHLKANPEALKHEVTGETLLLSAPPKELQAFLLKHADTRGAWVELEPFRKK